MEQSPDSIVPSGTLKRMRWASWGRPGAALVALLAAVLAFALEPAGAATRLKKPPEQTAPRKPATDGELLRVIDEPAEKSPFVGSIIFSRGSQIVAEIPDGAREGERLIVFDVRFRRKGKATVARALDELTYLLRPAGRLDASPGDRLARESEREAAGRVLRENRLESYQAFLKLFPKSAHRPRIAREMFRLTMQDSYPVFPGIVVEGKLRLVETVSRSVPRGEAQIVLDRFIIAETDGEGRFRIEGIPKVEEPVQLTLRVKDVRFQAAERVSVELPAGKISELSADLPVAVTPTILRGQVVDEGGAPIPGVEVWTSPYTMEALTDDEGGYQISRRKRLGGSVAEPSTDEPLFGEEYEVYAHRTGYSVERVTVAAESYQENAVPAIRLVAQDARTEKVPELALDLKDHLMLGPTTSMLPQGSTPMLNR